MKCLYEVLEIERSADEGTIRTAYRKLALRWHPDKNQADRALAEERFKDIQNAYEILCDAHERSWYDKHRESILRSGERHQTGSTAAPAAQRPDDEVDLYRYFSGSAFSGMGDGPRGFFGVYASLFATLAAQEAQAARERRAEGGAKKATAAPRAYPPFGSSGSSWAETAAFYAAWSDFSSAKDFAWADQHNPAAAPNRRTRRLVEAENDKARRAARREFAEGVREVVAFAKRRDPRVAARAKEEAARRAEAAAAAEARRAEERLARAARAAAAREAEARRREEEGGGESEEESEAEEVFAYECLACDKFFKSAAALDNHELSKKHRAAVALLRRLMDEEESGLGRGEKRAEDAPGESLQVESEDETDAEASGPASSSDGREDEEDAATERSTSSGCSSAETSADEADYLARMLQQQSVKEAANQAAPSGSEEEAEECKPEFLASTSRGGAGDDDDWGAPAGSLAKKGSRARAVRARAAKPRGKTAAHRAAAAVPASTVDNDVAATKLKKRAQRKAAVKL